MKHPYAQTSGTIDLNFGLILSTCASRKDHIARLCECTGSSEPPLLASAIACDETIHWALDSGFVRLLNALTKSSDAQPLFGYVLGSESIRGINVSSKVKCVFFLKSVLRLVTRIPLSIFDRGCSYLAQ